MWMLLAVVSVLVAIVGFAALSAATMGVGIIALACLLAIYARLAQASEFHRRLFPSAEQRPPKAA